MKRTWPKVRAARGGRGTDVSRIDHPGFATMKLAFRIYGLTAKERVVLGAIGSHLDTYGECTLSMETLAAETSIPRRRLGPIVEVLQDLKAIGVARRFSPRTGRYLSNAYTVDMEFLARVRQIESAAERKRREAEAPTAT